MKKVVMKLVVLVLAAGVFATVATAQQSPAGHWEGSIQIPGHEISIAVDLDKSSGGVWNGSMSVLHSTSIDVPLDSLAVEGTAVRFTANISKLASFEGHLEPDANSLSGSASNEEGSAPFELTRKGAPNVKIPVASSALPSEFEGNWEGTIRAGTQLLHVGLKLSRGDHGKARAVLIDDGNQEIPATTVIVEDKQINLESRAVSGSFRGALGEDGAISGEWAQGGQRVHIDFKRAPK